MSTRCLAAGSDQRPHTRRGWSLAAATALAAGLLFGGNVAPATAASEGSPDADFNAAVGTQLDGVVTSVAQQSDGKVVVGGMMDSPSSGVTRFNANGTPDAEFNANVGTIFGEGLSSNVESVLVQPDGKILATGWFVTPGIKLARINPDGQPDTEFNANVAAVLDSWVGGVALQSMVERTSKSSPALAVILVISSVCPFGQVAISWNRGELDSK